MINAYNLVYVFFNLSSVKNLTFHRNHVFSDVSFPDIDVPFKINLLYIRFFFYHVDKSQLIVVHPHIHLNIDNKVSSKNLLYGGADFVHVELFTGFNSISEESFGRNTPVPFYFDKVYYCGV